MRISNWTSPDFVDSYFLPDLGQVSPYDFVAVAPGPVVEDLDIIKEVGFRLLPCQIDSTPDAFLFQAAKERLGYSVVVTVASAAHAWHKAMLLAKPHPLIAAVLRALIRAECTITELLGRRRHTAIRSASSASSLANVGFIDQPITILDSKSIPTAM